MSPRTLTLSPAVFAGALFIAVAGLGAPRTSLAQPKPAPPSSAQPAPKLSPTEEARNLFKEGVKAGETDKNWPLAYEKFLAAWKLKQHPQVALALGRAEMETGRYREAVEHLQYCIDNSKPKDADAVLARDWLVTVQKKATKVTVKLDVAGARVLVDDVFVGKAPLPGPVLVNSGSHVFEARLADLRSQRGIVAEIGASIEVDLHLQPPGGTTAPGVPSSSTSAPSFFTPRHVLLLGGLVGTLAGVTVGVVAGVEAMTQQNSNYVVCKPLSEGGNLSKNDSLDCWSGREDLRQNLTSASFAGFVGAGVFALATGAFWWFGREDRKGTAPEKKTALVVSPVVSPTAVGFSLSGRW